MNLLLKKGDAVLEFGLPVHHASNADYGVCTAQSIDTATTQSITSPTDAEGRASWPTMQALSSAADTNWISLGQFSDTTKAHWLPPVNRALAWSEGVLTVDVHVATHTATAR
jgi:hypothetical protein